MNLMGRNLSSDMQGDDVALLHADLRRIGFTIPEEEARRAYFGPATRQAVLALQQAARLPMTGVVDADTASALARAAQMASDRPVQTASSAQFTTAPAGGGAAEGASAYPRAAIATAVGDPAAQMPQQPSAATQNTTLATSAPDDTIILPQSGAQPPQGGSGPERGDGGDGSEPFTVRGYVRLSDKSPLAGVTVQALKARVGHAPTLIAQGETRTDADGMYHIEYPSSTFGRGKAAALIVRALSARGGVLVTSPGITNPAPETTQDLIVSADAVDIPSEFERLVATLEPLLAEVTVQGVASPSLVQKLAGLTTEDLDLLAQSADLDHAKLNLLVGAAKMQLQAQGFGINLSMTAFYGAARAGMPLEPVGLFSRAWTALQPALERALKDNLIPASFAGGMAATVVAMQRFCVEAKLTTPAGPGLRPIRDLLALTIGPEQQIAFLTLQGAQQGTPDQFWAALRQQPGFQTPGLVEDLQLNDQLNQLTQNNVPLVAALRATYQVTSERALVSLTAQQWIDLINKQVGGRPIGVPPSASGETPRDVNVYVAEMMSALEKQYPTDAVAQVIGHINLGNVPPVIREGVRRFFANSRDFDLPQTHIDKYIAEHKATALNGIAPENQHAVVAEVKRIQRLYRVSGSARQTAVLLGSRFDSARAIVATPQAAFIREMQDGLGGAHAAITIYGKAQLIQALALHVATTLYQEVYGLRPQALGTPGAAAPQNNGSSGTGGGMTATALVESIPTLADLFGSMDTCACDECRSVLGPSAYLVDLLQLLDNTPAQAQQGANSMLQVLLQRRPDIPLINLTCENADTPLPYIDLVNEILEAYVAAYSSWYGTSHPNAWFGLWLKKYAQDVGNDDTGDATPNELLASPQYLLDAAYTELQSAIFPFILPFDFFLETARAYLQSQGGSLYQVMQTFQPDGLMASAPYATVAQSLDAEYLKLSPSEFRLLTHQQQFSSSGGQLTAATVADYYGHTLHVGHPARDTVGVGDVANLRTVCEFLDRTGLTLDELTRLLCMRTVNPSYPVIPVLQRLGLDYVSVWGASPAFTTFPQGVQDALHAAGVSVSAFTTWMTTPQAQAQAQTPGQTLGHVIVIGQQLVTGVNGIPTVECDTCKMQLEHIDGSPLNEGEWLWLYFFIRLWRKLGWAMEDLDNALANWLLPWPWALSQSPWISAALDMRVMVDQLSQVAQLHDTLNVPVADLLPLWVDFTGDASSLTNEGLNLISPRYQQLFLNRAVRKNDPIFQPTWQGIAPNPQDPNATPPNSAPSLDDHLFPLLAAFRLSDADLATIRAQTGLLPTTAQSRVPLTMKSLSAIYRCALLARALKLSVAELFSLMALSGLDPFADPATTIQFVQLRQTVKQSGFTIAQLNYLFRDLDTVSGSQAPKSDEILQLAGALRTRLDDIGQQVQEVQDPTGTVLQNALGKLLDAATVAEAMHMLDGSQVYSAPLDPSGYVDPSAFQQLSSDLQARITFAPPLTAPPQVGEIGLLRIRGPLSEADYSSVYAVGATLVNAPGKNRAAFTAAVGAIYSQPQDFISGAFGGFFATPQAQTDALAKLLGVGQNLLPQALTTAEKYQYVLHAFLPFLRDRLSHGFAKQMLATALNMDPSIATVLLENTDVLRSRTNSADAAVADVLALGTPGLTAGYEYFAVSSTSQTGLQTIDPAPLPQGVISARYMGSITSAGAGAYGFAVTTTPGALIQLALLDNGATVASFHAIAPLSTGNVIFPSCPLAANRAYDLMLTIFFPDTAPYGSVGAVQLYWTPPGQGQALATGAFTATYTASAIARGQVNAQQPIQASVFGSGVGWNPVGVGLATMPADTAIAAYSGVFTTPAGAASPIGFHLFVDTGALVSWALVDGQGNQINGSNGWQSANSGRVDWTSALTPGQAYSLSIQVMANASPGSSTCAALTGVQVMWDATPPQAIVPASQANGVTITYGVATPWPSTVVQKKTALIPALACQSADGTLPAGVFQADIQGMLLVASADTYTFVVTTDAGAQVRLSIGATTYGPVVASSSGECQFPPCDLAAGKAYALDVLILAPGAMQDTPQANQSPLTVARLSWSSATQTLTVVPGSQLIPASILSAFGDLYTVLRKITMLVTSLRLTADEIAYFSLNRAQFGGFDLNLITPSGAATQATNLMTMWQRVYAYAILRASLPQSQTTLLDVFALAAASSGSMFAGQAVSETGRAIATKVAAATGWDEQAVENLIIGLQIQSPTSFTNDVALVRLQNCLQQVSALGVSPAKLAKWATDALRGLLGATDAEDIKETIKAKYDDQSWLGVVHPLTDALRESRRDALVAYILALGASNGLVVNGIPVTDTNLLYEYLLLDIEMSPCMLTSRIVQATAAIQLFVQRCQLGLEATQVDAQAMDDHVWSWMKLYRVWQANREVFLWPENYLVESLRDDKTPFYKEFESALLQGQLTDDRIESAVSDYLAKLDQVANLEMCGLYWEQAYHPNDPKNNVDILHVFGRTRNTPHVFYYRRLENETSWTPWERVDLDIEGDHLIPAVWNSRLYLFWPRFTMKTLATQNTYWEVELAWSEYKRGTWQRKEVSHEIGYYPPVTERDVKDGVVGPTLGISGDISVLFPPQAFTFRAKVSDDGMLAITMYQHGTYGFLGVEDAGAVLEYDFNGRGGHIDVLTWPPVAEIWGPADAELSYMSFVWPPSSLDAPPASSSGELVVVSSVSGPVVVTSILAKASGAYDVLPAANSAQFFSSPAFLYQDATRVYLCLPSVAGRGLSFAHHFHPYTSRYVGDFSRGGMTTLLTLTNQGLRELTNAFQSTYSPWGTVVQPYPVERVDFERSWEIPLNPTDSPYVMYNWELFFHIPFQVAVSLSQNRSFDAAETMFRYIFDITKSPNYWQVLPFTTVDTQAQQIQNLLLSLNQGGDQSPVEDQIDAMQQHPFEPHLLARMRLSAYMKAVVMQYIDHHLAWGDQLYRMADQATDREFLNEALQHYILVAQLLGPRPVTIPNPGASKPQNYQQLKQDRLDPFSNAMVALENEFPFVPTQGGQGVGGTASIANVFYFCIPQNDQMLGYWDTIESRLYNIRNCLTLDGQALRLPLFAPPINPMLLVQAVAQGIDLGSVLSDIYAPLPYYRFSYILQKAIELCADVRAYGAALLSALEKQDAEGLVALRAGHETAIVRAMMSVKQAQLDEANLSLTALLGTRHVTEARFTTYQQWLGNQTPSVPLVGKVTDSSMGSPPGEQYKPHEMEHLDQLNQANTFQEIASGIEVASSVANYFPTYTQGGGSPSVSFGGPNVGAGLYAFARFFNALGAHHTYKATVASIKGGFDRRDDEWTLQLILATRELQQIDQQIAAAQKRVDIAATEITNHQLQIDHAQQVQDFLSSKFTNQDLYDWMKGQLSTLYYQAYSMAYDLAKQAERAYRFERGLSTSKYIQFGYWDSAHQGLMAGEQLHLALRQLERAYQDQNKRDYEITKQISLALTDPLALILLKETGACEVDLPESLFDADYPGQYMRRIKTMAITIPCVVGPYTSINCTLTLLSNTTRISNDAAMPYAEGDRDTRFVHNFASVQSIATSHGQSDSGLFELSFRDERYLPFEGAGAVSRWRIELPIDTNVFDRNSITDIVLRLQYTARDGGPQLQKVARKAMATDPTVTSGSRLFSARHEFAAQWIQFLSPSGASPATLQLDLARDRFAYQLRRKGVEIDTIACYLILSDLIGANKVSSLSVPYAATYQPQDPQVAPPTVTVLGPFAHNSSLDGLFTLESSISLNSSGENRGMLTLSVDQSNIPTDLRPNGQAPSARFDPTKVVDLLVVCEYTIREATGNH